MAVVTFRPNKDLTPVNHMKLHGNNAFEEIKEITADNDSTYIYQSISKQESMANSKINFHSNSLVTLNSNDKIIRADLIIVAHKIEQKTTAFCGGKITLGGVETSLQESALTTQYTQHKFSFTQDFINFFKTNKTLQDIPIVLNTTGTFIGEKWESSSSITITQSYLELEYELGQPDKSSFFIKNGKNWEEYKDIYEKRNGKWVLIDPSQIFGSIQNNTDTKFVYGGTK